MCPDMATMRVVLAVWKADGISRDTGEGLGRALLEPVTDPRILETPSKDLRWKTYQYAGTHFGSVKNLALVFIPQ